MGLKAKRQLWLVLVALGFSLLAGCLDQSVSSEPPRPASLPDQSIWVGGPDGGAFVWVREPENEVYAANVYFQDGEVWFAGPMVLNREPGKTFDVRDPRSYSGWDGEALHLSDGRSLVKKQ